MTNRDRSSTAIAALIVAVTSIVAIQASGHVEHDESSVDEAVQPADIMMERAVKGTGARGQIDELSLRLHRAGHDLDQPFTLEFRARCSGEKELGPVFDTISACDIAVNSISFDPLTQIATVVVREPDLRQIERRSQVQTLTESTRICKSRAKKLRIHLSHGCSGSSD